MQELVNLANAIGIANECRVLRATALRPVRAKGYFNAKLLLSSSADAEDGDAPEAAAAEAPVLIVSDEEQSGAEDDEPGTQAMATSDPTVLDDTEMLPSIPELPPPLVAASASATPAPSAPAPVPHEQPPQQQESQAANGEADAIFIDEDDQAAPEATPFQAATPQRTSSTASASVAIPTSETSFARELTRAASSAASSPALPRKTLAPVAEVSATQSSEAAVANNAEDALDYNQWVHTMAAGGRNVTLAVEPTDAPASPPQAELSDAPLDEVEVLDEDNGSVHEEVGAMQLHPPPLARQTSPSKSSSSSARKRKRTRSRPSHSSRPSADDDEDTMPLANMARPQTAKRSKPGLVREEDLLESTTPTQSVSHVSYSQSDKQLGKLYKKELGHKVKVDEVLSDRLIFDTFDMPPLTFIIIISSEIWSVLRTLGWGGSIL